MFYVKKNFQPSLNFFLLGLSISHALPLDFTYIFIVNAVHKTSSVKRHYVMMGSRPLKGAVPLDLRPLALRSPPNVDDGSTPLPGNGDRQKVTHRKQQKIDERRYYLGSTLPVSPC